MNGPALFLIAGSVLIFCRPWLLTNGIVGNFGDIYQYAAPFRDFARTALQSGRMPLWNPHIFAGAPFLASPQSALFYPLSALFDFLPLRVAFNAFTAFHFFLNALAMFLCLRSLRCSRSGSFLGSLFWSFSFFFLARAAAGHVIHLSGYAWTPLVVLFAVRTISKPQEDLMNVPFAGLVGSSLLQFFSGHLQVWLYTVFFMALLFIRELVRGKRETRALQVRTAVAFILIFTGLSLVQLFPTFIYMAQSSRYQPADFLSEKTAYVFATSYSMPWKALLGLFAPDAFGNPIGGTFLDPDHPSVYFETYALYLGLLPVCLAALGLGLSLRRKQFFLPGMAIAFLALAAGQYNPFYPWIWKLLNFQRVPARFFLLSFLALAFLAVRFWDEALARRSRGLKLLLIALTFLDLFVHGHKFIWSEDYESKMGKSETAQFLQEKLGDPKTEMPVHYPLNVSPYRIFTGADVPNPNKTMLLGLSNGNGYEAILQKSLLRFFALTQKGSDVSSTGVDVANPASPSFQLMSARYLVSRKPQPPGWTLAGENGPLKIYQNPGALFPVQALFKRRTFEDAPSLLAFMDSGLYDPRMEILDEKPEPFGAQAKPLGSKTTLPQKEAALYSYIRRSPERIELRWKSEDPGNFWIFLSEAHYPGWEVWTENGERLTPFRADGYFQGVLFEKSKARTEKVFWRFAPLDFRIGAWCGALSLLALGILAVKTKERWQV